MNDQKLGLKLEEEGHFGLAIAAFYRALQKDPSNLTLWSQFAHAFRFVQFVQLDEKLKQAILTCFDQPIGNHQDLVFASLSLLKCSPSFNHLLQATYENLKEQTLSGQIFEQLEDPLWMSLMKKTILPDPAIEHLLTQLRKILLETFVEGKTHFGTQNSVLYALAMHCFLNEYVYYATKEEIAQIEALCKKFDLNHPALVAMIGCYRPLYTLVQNSTSWKGNDAYQQLMILQVAHPLEEQNLEIPSYGGIKNAISKKVKAQYESAPYPRWFGLYSSEPTTIPQFFKKMFPNLQEALSFPEIPQILIAGCGTGQQAFNTANTFRNSQVLAVDLSRASLAYAKRKQQELHIENIQFLQADILEIDVPVQFDLIECIGVLHHLENPMEGLRHLERMLKPGGWMEIGLYSETARQDIVAARQFISENGYGSTDDDIRQCRQDLLALPLDHPAKSVAQTIDFFTLSGCRDLLFHVQECRFTLQEIAKMLKSLHLEFIGFELRDKTLKRKYLEQFPHDPLAISLDNWGQFEEENPLTFIGMYQFWIRKKKIY